MGGEHGAAVQRAGHIDRHRAGRGGRVGIGHRADVAEQAGVVHPQVDAPEPGHHLVGEALERGPVGHVHRGHDRGLRPVDTSVVRSGARANGQRRCVPCAEPEVHARGGEVDGQPGTEATARPGDDSDPAAGRHDHALRRTDRPSA